MDNITNQTMQDNTMNTNTTKITEEAKDVEMQNIAVSTELTAHTTHEEGQMVDRRELVPKEERAVTLEIDMKKIRVETFHPSLESLMPDTEKALAGTDTDVKPYQTVSENGLFSPVAGMGNIKGSMDDSIYAARRIDSEGNRSFVFCQRLANGGYSPKLSIDQAILYKLAKAFYNVGNLTTRKKDMENYLGELEDKYLNGIDLAEDDPYEFMDILKLLYKTRSLLPESKEKASDPAIELYEKIKLELDLMQVLTSVERQAYYALAENNFVELAKKLGMGRVELARKLKEYNLLYLQESSGGYQTKVRLVDGCLNNVYCIYRLEYFDKVTGKMPPEEEELPL